MYWRMCPRAGIEKLAFDFSVQKLLPHIHPQIIAVTPIAQLIAASDASGTSNAFATVRGAFLPSLTSVKGMAEL
jgi:hypothetical protein